MPFGVDLGFLDSAFQTVRGLVDDVTTSDEEKKKALAKLEKVRNKARQDAREHIENITEQKKEVLLGEIEGESWLQRNWRPLLMLALTLILVNNFILAPYINALAGPEYSIVLEFPSQFWNLLTVGVGGYIGARTYEKTQGATTEAERKRKQISAPNPMGRQGMEIEPVRMPARPPKTNQ
jgi:hypothetical protein